MNSLLAKLLAPRRMEYLTVDKNLMIVEASWGVQRFADDPNQVKKGKDIRLGFPEIIGIEEQLIAVIEERHTSFELKGIARFSEQNNPLYIDIYFISDKAPEALENNLILALEDVTDKMIVEQTLVQRTNEATLLLNNLTAANAYIDKIISSIADALIVTNKIGNIKRVNKATQSLFGYKEEELINEPISKIIKDHKFILPVYQLPYLSSNEILQPLEVSCKNKTGEEIFIAFSCSKIETEIEELEDFVYIGRDISDRQRSEAERAKLLACEQAARTAAEASEQRFRFLAEAIPQQVWTAQPDGQLDYVNQRTLDYFELTSEQLLGMGWLQVLHPEDLSTCIERWMNSLKTGELYEVEFRLRRAADGAYRWHIGRALPMRNEQGAIVNWFGTNTDIDDQKQAEQELRCNEAAIRSLYKVASARKLNFDKRIQGLLSLGRRHFGLEVGNLAQINDVVSEAVTDTKHTADYKQIVSPESDRFQIIAAQFPPNSSFKMNKGDIVNLRETYCSEAFSATEPTCFEAAGKSYWCSHNTSQGANIEAYIGIPVVVAGKPYGVLSFFSCKERHKLFTAGEKGFLKLMAQWVGSEVERQQTLEALQHSEERFRLLVEGVRDYAIIMLDAKGHIISWNTGSERIHQYQADEILNHHFSCFYLPEDIANGIPQQLLDLAIANGHGEDEGWRLRKDGSRFWANVVITTLQDENGHIRGFAKVTRDITERKQAEEEIRKALQKEKELNELKSRFISMASHEFRTPLATILASSDLIKRFGDKLNTEKKVERLNKIQAEVKNMTRLLDDVLIIGKAEANKLECNPIPIDLKKLCKEILEEMEVTFGAKHKFNFKYKENGKLAIVDEKLLRHILNNLLSNAVKYSPQTNNIYFELICKDDEAIFQIRDEGIGIPEVDRKRLFETFYRASNVGNISGTGLGLAIIKNAVELHGGSIEVKSKVGIGTTFTVYIPTFNEGESI